VRTNANSIGASSAKDFEPKKESFFSYVCKNKALYLMLIPGILYLLIFKFAPMYGILISFKDFNFVKGVWGSEWVGLKYFKELFFNSPAFWTAAKNSLLLSIYNIIFGFPAPIILAVLLNEVRKHTGFKKSLQTVFYLPHFISWVIIAGIITNFLSPTTGLVNYIIQYFGGESIAFLQKPEYFRRILVIGNLWKETGYESVVFLAAITQIDQELYEAGYIDGANRFQRMRYITIPSIMGTITTMLILRLGRILTNGFDSVFMLYSPLTYETADTLETFTYRLGLQSGQYSYSTAAGLFSSVIGFFLIITTNWFSRKVSENSIW